MLSGRIAGHGRGVRAILALTAASACIGAAAYAATGPVPALGGSKPVPAPPRNGTGPAAGGKADGKEAQPLARLIEYPEQDSAAAEVQFRFHVQSRSKSPAVEGPAGPPRESESPRRFQCRLDGARWAACGSPHRLGGLAPGDHAFRVRALSRDGRPGPAAAYSWQRLSPRPPEQHVDAAAVPFSIELRGDLAELYPGHPPQQVPLVVTNPNSQPIEVTGLTVAVGDGAPSCPAENFALTQSSVSPGTPLTIPAGASLELPSAAVSAPTISMLNLPVNQDHCQGAEVPLVFSGEARG
jgi:hypothetical protein